jgi:hypothetical protein
MGHQLGRYKYHQLGRYKYDGTNITPQQALERLYDP